MNDSIERILREIEIPEDLHERAVIGIEQADGEGRIYMTRSVKRIIAIAAAVILMTVTVASVTAFTDLIGEQRAFGAAATYVVMHADSEEQSLKLTDMILSGYIYDRSSEETQVKMGISGLRPIYDVRFKVIGFSYSVQVDAKTGVVLSCTRDVDEDWEEHLVSNDNHDAEYQMKMSDAMYIAQDRFGLYYTGDCKDSLLESGANPEIDGDPNKIGIWMNHGGYTYTCVVDTQSGDVIDAEITEISDYSKERHLHEASDEFIGLYKASLIIQEKFGITYSSDSLFLSDNGSVFAEVRFEPAVYVLADRTIDRGYGTEVYRAHVQLKNQNLSESIIIDARTGEILDSIYRASQGVPTYITNGDSMHVYDPDVSTEAPEGMISEAEATAIALDDAGIEQIQVSGFAVILEDGQYKITFEGSKLNERGRGQRYCFTYFIDAYIGEITDSKYEKKR